MVYTFYHQPCPEPGLSGDKNTPVLPDGFLRRKFSLKFSISDPIQPQLISVKMAETKKVKSPKDFASSSPPCRCNVTVF
jgi:hypothetical protein